MTAWPPHAYRTAAASRGIETSTIDSAIAQARRVQNQGLPAILTLRHLAEMTNVPYTTLRRYAERSEEEPYRFFSMAKRSGGYRLICVPQWPLLIAQKWLARYVLRETNPHCRSFAYKKGRSIFSCAQEHCGCKWLIKIDVQQFFESISERQVFHSFRSLGYEPLISFELARLCTRTASSDNRKYALKKRWQNGPSATRTKISSYAYGHIGHLPQGAPTSPMLSNLAMVRLDMALDELAASQGLVYTRYADDLAFSHSGSYSRNQAEELVRIVFGKIQAEGLRPHTTKTLIAPPGARKIILGLLVDRQRPRLQRVFRSSLEQHVYCLTRNGPTTHAARRGFRSIFSMRRHLEGRLNFANQVDSQFAAPLIEAFDSVAWPS